VASYVERINGAIGYVEYAYALQNHIPYTKLKNRSGRYVVPSQKTFAAAAAGVNWKQAPGFYVILTNQRGKNAWPITGATFILVYKKARKPETTQAALKFFDWAYHNGDKMAKSLDYIPMPKNVTKLVEHAWHKKIHGPKGKALWPHS
jgi:phosphate transport system substrate-binding protein